MAKSTRARHFLLLAVVVGAQVPAQAEQAAQAPVIESSNPAVSPDGSRIAFLSKQDGTTDVYVSSTDGTGLVRLTRTPEEEGPPDWSPDGRQIWFAVFANDTSRLYAIDPDGKNQRPLGSVPGRSAKLSPNGHRVLYSLGSWTAVRLMVSALDGSQAQPLTDGSSVVWNVRWSPDGKRIAFTGRDSANVLNVWMMNADGSERRQLTHIATAEGQAQVPSWSPDGRELAIQVTKPHFGHIWIVDVATGAARKLAAHTQPYLDEVPAWFPDGKRIAFQSDRTGRMEVWVMNVDGSGQYQVTR